jgi:GTP-binding protein Era
MENKSFKSGYIGLVGRTNVGKSTLINKIFDRNIVITSDKAQTTRSRINCIYNADDAQAIFVDCPGFFKPRNLLGEKLNRIIFQVLDDVDIIVAMVDFPGGIGVGDYYVFEQIRSRHVPKILILNKIDLLNTAGKYSLLETISKIRSELDFFEEIIPVSASTGENLEKLLKVLMGRLPIGPMYYPGGMVTDMPINKMIAEIIREKLSANLFDELPHSINVEVVNLQRKGAGMGKGAGPGKGFGIQEDAFMQQETDMAQWGGPEKAAGLKMAANAKEDALTQYETDIQQTADIQKETGVGIVAATAKGNELVTIECNIYVEKKSHKAMIIGKSGSMLKKIGGLSRLEIEKLLDSKVFLKLWVKVEENWTRKEAYLDRFGY